MSDGERDCGEKASEGRQQGAQDGRMTQFSVGSWGGLPEIVTCEQRLEGAEE